MDIKQLRGLYKSSLICNDLLKYLIILYELFCMFYRMNQRLQHINTKRDSKDETGEEKNHTDEQTRLMHKNDSTGDNTMYFMLENSKCFCMNNSS